MGLDLKVVFFIVVTLLGILLSGAVWAGTVAISESATNTTAYVGSAVELFANGTTTKTGGALSYEYIVYVNGTQYSTGNASRAVAYSENAASYGQSLNAGENFAYMNYSVNANETYALVWMVKHSILSTYNMTLPSTCDQQSPRQLKLQSGVGGESYPACYNGTAWEITGTDSSGYSWDGGGGAISHCGAAVNWYDGNWSLGSSDIAEGITGCLGGFLADIGSGSAFGHPFLWEEGVYRTEGYANGTRVNVANLSSGFVKGTNLTFSVRGFDGANRSLYTNSSTLTISNTAPVATEVFVVAVTGGVNCSYEWSDADAVDADSGTTYRWFKNSSVQSPTTKFFGSGNYSEGDILVCEVTPSDGVDSGAAVNSSEHAAGDVTAPTISGVIVPTSATAGTAVSLYASCSDGNGVANNYPKVQWRDSSLLTYGNYSLSLISGTEYLLSVSLNVGTYSGFRFYCKDGANNEDVYDYAGTLTVSGSGAGGGGGGNTKLVSNTTGARLVYPPSGSFSVLCFPEGVALRPLVMDVQNPLKTATHYKVRAEGLSCSNATQDVFMDGLASRPVAVEGCTCPSTPESGSIVFLDERSFADGVVLRVPVRVVPSPRALLLDPVLVGVVVLVIVGFMVFVAATR